MVRSQMFQMERLTIVGRAASMMSALLEPPSTAGWNALSWKSGRLSPRNNRRPQIGP